MALTLLDGWDTGDAIAFTLMTENGLQTLSGSREQVATLASLMKQTSVLAAAGEVTDPIWLGATPVGDASVRCGLRPGGEARIAITRG